MLIRKNEWGPSKNQKGRNFIKYITNFHDRGVWIRILCFPESESNPEKFESGVIWLRGWIQSISDRLRIPCTHHPVLLFLVCYWNAGQRTLSSMSEPEIINSLRGQVIIRCVASLLVTLSLTHWFNDSLFHWLSTHDPLRFQHSSSASALPFNP